MPSKTINLPIAGVAGLCLLAIALYWQSGWSAAEPSQPAGTARISTHSAPTVGDDRTAMLQEFTRQYALLNESASSRMKAGIELAPVEFLNEQLERLGAKWRVSRVEGLVADTYEVS